MLEGNAATREDYDQHSRLAERYEKLLDSFGFRKPERMTIMMDLDYVKPAINYDQLESFDDSNFLHDMSGIGRNISRHDGTLMNCFLPRCGVAE